VADRLIVKGAREHNLQSVDLDLPREVTVVAVVRHDRLVVPRGDTCLSPGDEVLLLVTGESEEAVQRILVGSPRP